MILWGWSPADGTFGTNNPQYLRWAHERGARVVSVDLTGDGGWTQQ
jgi:hypothetical protein